MTTTITIQQFSTSKKITATLVVHHMKHSSNALGSMYPSNHPRQIILQKSIVEHLIIQLGLPLSLIERSSFIKFMNHVDSRFTMISRRTLTCTILPNLY